MMLSTRETLFAWSRADRRADISFFRVMSQNWQPVVRPRLATESAAPKSTGKLPECMRPRPTWTPWLFIR